MVDDQIALMGAYDYLQNEFRSSLFLTCKELLGYKDMTQKTHGDMVRCLESSVTRKLIVMPRGTFKSSIGVVGFAIWLLIRNPNLRILIDSEVYTNSKNFMREIKAHFKGDKFMAIFGDWQGELWTESEIVVNKRTKKLKEASIVCGGIGTVKVGQHFDVIISDDLNSKNNSQTADGCRKVIEHFQLNSAILEPDGIYVLIGTRYSQADAIGFILDNFLLPSTTKA